MNYIWGAMLLIGIIYGTVTGQVDAVSDAVLSSAKEAVTLCITMLGVMGLWMGLMEIAKEAGMIGAISAKIQPLIHFLFPGIPGEHPANEHITMNMVANFLGLGWAATPAGLKAMEELAALEEERRQEDGKKAGTDDMDGRIKSGEGTEKRAGKSVGEKAAETAGRKRTMEKNGSVNDKTQGMRRKAWRRIPGHIAAMPRGVASNEMCTFLILNISSLQLIPVNVIAYRSQYGSVNPTAIVGPGIVATAVSTAVAVVFCKVMDRRRRA